MIIYDLINLRRFQQLNNVVPEFLSAAKSQLPAIRYLVTFSEPIRMFWDQMLYFDRLSNRVQHDVPICENVAIL